MSGFYATIARYYDSEHHDKDEDLPFYSDLLEDQGSPALIIGSGSGRVLFHLARQGYDVHGIEAETAMFERGLRKLAALPHIRKHITMSNQNVFDVQIEGRFKVGIIPYNTLMHFHEQDAQLALLKRLRTWIEPSGVLAIDLPNAGDVFGTLDNAAVTFERSFVDLETGHMVMQQSVSELDRTEQLMHVTWIYDEIDEDGVVKRTVAPVINRYFFFAELRLLLAASGFEEVLVYGDFDYSEFADGAPRMIVLAK
jgi:SAM-dependent methyltransferase